MSRIDILFRLSTDFSIGGALSERKSGLPRDKRGYSQLYYRSLTRDKIWMEG